MGNGSDRSTGSRFEDRSEIPTRPTRDIKGCAKIVVLLRNGAIFIIEQCKQIQFKIEFLCSVR